MMDAMPAPTTPLQHLSPEEATRALLNESGLYQVVGPPGTGKTTWLINAVTAALQNGIRLADQMSEISPHDITIVAFTRAAALNAQTRLQAANIDIPSENVGTLHSLTLQALQQEREAQGLERPRLVQDPKAIAAWNERHPDLLRSADTGEDDAVQKQTPADKILTRIDGQRARMIPVELWPDDLRAFNAKYEEFKADENLLDFTDLIEIATTQTLFPPGIGMLLADEAQDFSPLEWKLLLQWTNVVNHTVVIGDDDQAIYGGLKGASPEQFVNLDVPEHHRIVLSQSYRVPAAAHAFAEAITDQISTRLPKTYRPRDEIGELRFTPATWMKPQPMLANLKKLPGTVMILAYSKYMLEPTIAMLRENLIPFHNPYRPTYGAWNPLGQDGTSSITARTRVQAFLKPEWTPRDILNWSGILVGKGVFPRGMRDRMKDDLETLDDDIIPDIRAYLEADAFEALTRRDLAFYEAHLATKAKNARMKMVLKLAAEGMLNEDPRIIVGTMHSVKGGEAESVIMFPDYPDAATDMDENLRVMYVGASRTLKLLVVATANNATPDEDAPPEQGLQTQKVLRQARRKLREQQANHA